MEAHLSEPFFTRRMKLLSRPDGFMLYGKLGIDFFSTSELLYPNMKIRLRLIRARPNFYMVSDNPNVSLGIVDCSLYTRRIALKNDYHKKRMDMLAYAPVEYNYLETWQRRSSYLRDKTNSFKKTSSTMPPFVGMLLQWSQTLPLLVLLLTTHTGINNLISDKFEYSEGDSQLLILILLTIVYMWLPGKQWTFRMIFPRSPLMSSKITMCWCLTWLQCMTLLKTVTILNLLENHWDWS